jgi:4-diphosphocytidyl-2-C-methyl-D-erythritol kinase
MNTVSMRAYAKINLGLDVIGKLENGYHEVRMIMQSINLYDKVSVTRNKTGRINVKTNLTFLPTGPDNLVYRAAAMLIEEFGIQDGVDIDLYKFIPVAAGMAGGSTDAAAVLKAVNKIFGLGLDDGALMERGAKLGADIPYCIMGGTALAEGIGERLTPLPKCPRFYLVIAKPGISVSTKMVYGSLRLDDTIIHPDTEGIIEAITNKDVEGIADRLCNVLESVTVKEYPVIQDIKTEMIRYGALNSLMSGSGPTVFGIFTDENKAKECNEYLRKSRMVRNSYVAEPV